MGTYSRMVYQTGQTNSSALKNKIYNYEWEGPTRWKWEGPQIRG